MTGDAMIGVLHPRELAHRMLSFDLQAHRIAAGERDRLVDVALTDGRDLANAAAACGSADPDSVAERFGVPVNDSDGEGGYGTTLVFAEYTARPPRIVLYRRAIADLDRRLAQTKASETLGLTRTRPLFLAHELYHHLDLERGECALARRERITLLKLGGLRWKSGITSLPEIAAGAFAQRLLGLRFHPKWLDLLLPGRELPTQRSSA